MIHVALSVQRSFMFPADLAAGPKRLEWKLVPDQVIERLAENRTRQHLSDMTDRFIARDRRIPPVSR